jgi:hypothetical protein
MCDCVDAYVSVFFPTLSLQLPVHYNTITRRDKAEGTREDRKIHRKEEVYGAACVGMIGYM